MAMNIQWYPGHMTKAKREMQEDLNLIDLIIEIVDARVPFSSRNPDIDAMAKNKARLLILNKSDLADPVQNDRFMEWFQKRGFFVVKANSKSGAGIRQIDQVIKAACKEKMERDAKRGIKNRPVRAMVTGIPNVGKSTFINSYAGKACTKTGNKPGVTKGKQWIRMGKNLELLDTPGILWPKFEDKTAGQNLAFIGSINDEILQTTELAFELMKLLLQNYPEGLRERFRITEDMEPLAALYQVAEVRGCKLKGNEPDLEKASAIVLDEFRSGKLGKITLDGIGNDE